MPLAAKSSPPPILQPLATLEHSTSTTPSNIDHSPFSPTSREADVRSMVSFHAYANSDDNRSSSSQPAVPAAPYPFSSTSPDADVIIRAADGALFYVHRVVLTHASPFFADMFSLPQPGGYPESPCCSPRSPGSSLHSATPVVQVSEPSSIITPLLQLTYPLPEPQIPSLSVLSELLVASTKYDLTRSTSILRRHLVSSKYLSESPMRVYAIACRHEFEEESRIAGLATLRVQVLDCELSDDLRWISAWHYHRLLTLHKQIASDLIKIVELAVPSYLTSTINTHTQPETEPTYTFSSQPTCAQCASAHYSAFSPPRWWIDFAQRACTELSKRPALDVVFLPNFLGKSAVNGCQRCAAGAWEASAEGGFLDELKKRCEDSVGAVNLKAKGW